MFIGDLFEDGSSRRIVVTYPGRFQPFHLGHAEVFRSLQSKFGADNVFIVTSNKVDGEKSPFNFSDKVRFMHAAGIPDHSIIEASQVYKLPDQFDGQKENLIFVVAVGEPDKQRLNPGTITKKTGGPSYFQNLPEDLDQAEMSDRHGYVVVASERQKTVSIGGKQYDVSHGTEVRKLWNHIRNSPEQRQAFMKQLYGRSDPDLANILDKIPQSMAEEGGVGVVKAGDKRYSNALTVDVKPDTLGKEMKAYGLVGRKSPSTQQQKVGKDVGKGVYDGVSEGFNSKQEVIDHFVKQGKSAAAGAMAWERGWRGNTPKKKPLRPPVRSYHDDLDDKRYDVKEAEIIKRMLAIKEELDTLKPKLAKYKISEMSSGGTGAGGISTAPSAGGGSLFGGSYERKDNPFAAPVKKKKANKK